MGRLAIMDHTGDFRLEWGPKEDAATAAVLEEAKTKFDEARKKGYVAYATFDRGRRSEILKRFDPEADTVMRPAMQGG